MPDDANSNLTDLANKTFVASGGQAGAAVPSYMLRRVNYLNEFTLVPFKDVISGFTGLSGAGNLENIWLTEIESEVNDAPSREAREALKVMAGKSPHGFNFMPLEVAGEKGKCEYIYVLEDALRNQVMIIGPCKIADAGLRKEIESSDSIVYADRADRKTPAMINDFILQGLKYRGREERLERFYPVSCVNSLRAAFTRASGKTLDGDNTVTLGTAIAENTAPPRIYASILMPKM